MFYSWLTFSHVSIGLLQPSSGPAADALARSDGDSISSSSAPCAPRCVECSAFFIPISSLKTQREP